MNQIIIVLFFTLIFLLFNKKVEGFSNEIPSYWKELSQKQCDFLKEEIKKVDKQLESCKNSNYNITRTYINDSYQCRDATEMQIFNNRESNLWCNMAQNIPPKEDVFYGTQVKGINSDVYIIQNDGLEELSKKEESNDKIVPSKENKEDPYIRFSAPLYNGIDDKNQFALIN